MVATWRCLKNISFFFLHLLVSMLWWRRVSHGPSFLFHVTHLHFFNAQIVPDFVSGSPLKLALKFLCTHFSHSSRTSLLPDTIECSRLILYFHRSKPRSCHFSSMSRLLFIKKQYLRTKMWSQDVLIPAGVSLFLGSFREEKVHLPYTNVSNLNPISWGSSS